MQAVDGAKMMYLIRRRTGVTRDALVANWFANHMPQVIGAMHAAREAGRPHASRYIATLFDGDGSWDGVAQLWWPMALPRPAAPHGEPPTDTFQQLAEPYVPWVTREYVVIDGEVPTSPNTLNAPYPCTRGGFLKVTFFVKAKPDTDYEAFYGHWLTVHADNVSSVMRQVGGFRYAISHSLEPQAESYDGMAELYFADAAGWDRYRALIEDDGMSRWVERSGVEIRTTTTEMVGIP